MNAYELAETRVMLDRIGMHDWTIRYTPSGVFYDPKALAMGGMATDFLFAEPYHFINPGSGYRIDVYRKVNATTGKAYAWYVCVGNIQTPEAWQWHQMHDELESALGALHVQIRKAGIA